MTAGRPLLAAVWLLLALVPFAWWLATRRAVNTWQSLPVPAALLDRDGNITSRTGPDDADFTMAGGLPPAGRIARTRTSSGTPLQLAPKEFDLLAFLLEHPGQVFGKTQLLAHVWGADFDGDPHTVESRMSRLRLTIEDNPNRPAHLHNRRGVGYYLTLDPR